MHDNYDDGKYLNSPLGGGMKAMIISRAEIDHCLNYRE